MTPLQQYIFEKAIAVMKQSNGEHNFYLSIYKKEEDAHQADISTFNKETSTVIRFMQVEGYITRKYPSSLPLYMILTQKGWDFTSFADAQRVKEENKFQAQQQMEKLSLELQQLREQFFDYPTVRRRARDAHNWMIVSVIIAILAVVISLVKK